MKIRITSTPRLRLRAGKVGLVGEFGGTAADSVTLIDFALDYQGFQHVSGSKNIPVSVNYTGSPSLIEVRAVNDETGIAVTPWTTLAANPSGGLASGFLNVAAALRFCRLEARCGVNTALVSSGTKRFGVGIFVIQWGQSNMANRTSANGPRYPLSSKYVREFSTAGVFRRFGNINDTYPPNTLYGTYSSYTGSGGSVGDGDVMFANLLAAALQMPVFLINRAVGGSEISSWIEDNNAGVDNNWDKLRKAIIAATGGDFELAIGQIGETDANSKTQAYMETNFAAVHANMKTLSGRNNSNFKFGLCSLGQGSYLTSVEGDFGRMRLAVQAYCNNTGAYLATSYHDTLTSDTVHILGEGFGRGQPREAKSFLATQGIGTSGAGPRIVSALRSGLDVVFTVVHAGGTNLTDGAGGTGAALTGFQFYDEGAARAAIAYTATAILSPTSIRVTLASLPAGVLKARYGIMNVPHGTNNNPQTFVAASCVYDNALPFNSTVGCPMQVCAELTVN
jgi:hypothetical protein